MHHPTYYQVMLEQGAQIDIVNQQPTRISTSSLSLEFISSPELLLAKCKIPDLPDLTEMSLMGIITITCRLTLPLIG
jgi:hypothetical protein